MKFNFEKPLSQEATDTHIIINNLKLSDTVSRDYIKSHSAMNSNILTEIFGSSIVAQSILFVLTDTNMAATSLIDFNHV